MEKLNSNKESLESIPLDFSFRKITALDKVDMRQARSSRLGGIPKLSNKNKRFLTCSIWINNNKLKDIKNVEKMVEDLLEYPQQLGWIDFSFNYIKTIDDGILKFPNLKILYLHGNCIETIDEIFKLRSLKYLRTVTLHGNPISNLNYYRATIIAALPQLVNLDFVPISKVERMLPLPGEMLIKLKNIK